MNTRSIPGLAIVFAMAYIIVYALAVWNNYALFTYHPALGEIFWGVEKPRDGPAMYWYGWLFTAALGALAACVVAWLLPQRLMQRLWHGWTWVIPLCALLAFVVLLRNYFLR